MSISLLFIRISIESGEQCQGHVKVAFIYNEPGSLDSYLEILLAISKLTEYASTVSTTDTPVRRLDNH